MAAPAGGAVISPVKRKRALADPSCSDEISQADTGAAEFSPSRKKKKQMRSQLFDENDDAASNVMTSSPPSLADTNTATATIADTNTPLTEASSRRSTTKPRPKKYHCTFPDCNKAYNRPIHLQTHINSHTGERPHVCPNFDCDKSFFKPEHLNRHMKEKHGDQTFVCTFEVHKEEIGGMEPCGKKFESANKLKRHVAAHEDKEETTCSWEGCGKVFRKQETLQRHIKKDHLNEDCYQCTRQTADGGICGAMFPTPGQLKSHEAKEHEAPKYVCDICTSAMIPPPEDDTPVPNDLDPEFLPRAEDLQEPEEALDAKSFGNLSLDDAGPPSMRGPGDIVCFPTYHDLQRHNKVVHPPVCVECGKRCKSNKDLAAHIEIHHSAPGVSSNVSTEAEKKFLCPHEGCPRSMPNNGFTKKGNMAVHFKTAHGNHKGFVCGELDLSGNSKVEGWNGHGCGMALTAKQALISHIRTQHMGLPGIGDEKRKERRQAKSRKRAATKNGDVGEMDIDLEMAGPSMAMSMLTGGGYEELRPIACLLAGSPHGCQMRFVREYDLCTHLELTHEWNVDDINEALGATPGAQPPEEDDMLRQQLEEGMAAMQGSDGIAIDPGL